MYRRALTTFTRAARSGMRSQASKPAQTFFQTSTAPRIPAISQPAARRWYSEAKETEAPKETEKAEGEKADDAESALKKQLEAKEKEVADWKDKCLRTIADFRNLQDRTARDVKQAKDFALQKFAKDLIESIDNLDRALTNVPQEKLAVADKTGDLLELSNLYDGLKMTENILMTTLKKHGIERVSPEGEKYNPNEHDATFMAPQPGKDNNTIFHVQEKGFKLNGRVLRAPKVGVVQNA
ncbi:GrpE protein-like protein [Colletotrichum orbiculare MAFF 240422]|uniref:GrpE protein homolog, mitochondrial n=3 Tax=Colletotrichum orbiculare species complex TaxID=2707354 RepID=N4W3H2_COLOR|nr:GrpE protein-like protein [Colletotrichum orbiculare MAFF 240422]TDZ37857.1 GrpE protein-like protein [Colletotrichum spinosum]TDZ74542.1 GrpE protein-like protein [Colletotrichum trifolii]